MSFEALDTFCSPPRLEPCNCSLQDLATVAYKTLQLLPTRSWQLLPKEWVFPIPLQAPPLPCKTWECQGGALGSTVSLLGSRFQHCQLQEALLWERDFAFLCFSFSSVKRKRKRKTPSPRPPLPPKKTSAIFKAILKIREIKFIRSLAYRRYTINAASLSFQFFLSFKTAIYVFSSHYFKFFFLGACLKCVY